MSKLPINMIGGHFQFDICSSLGSVPQHMEWVKGHHHADISFYIDEATKMVPDPNRENYGWLVEPLSMNKPFYEWIILGDGINWYERYFETVFTHDERLLDKSPIFKLSSPLAVPWIKEHEIYPKSKLVSMMATNKEGHNPGHQYRRRIMDRYYNDVDIYGHGEIVPKIDALKDYMFSIVMENEEGMMSR